MFDLIKLDFVNFTAAEIRSDAERFFDTTERTIIAVIENPGFFARRNFFTNQKIGRRIEKKFCRHAARVCQNYDICGFTVENFTAAGNGFRFFLFVIEPEIISEICFGLKIAAFFSDERLQTFARIAQPAGFAVKTGFVFKAFDLNKSVIKNRFDGLNPDLAFHSVFEPRDQTAFGIRVYFLQIFLSAVRFFGLFENG